MGYPLTMTIDRAIQFIEAIFGPLGSEAGVSVEDIVAAERALGVSLPHALRELYARTGSLKALHAVHNTIVPIERVGLAADHLVFYEENQGVVAWGIPRSRLSEADPPVDQGQPPNAARDAWTFCPEFTSVSEFVCAQAAWQAVQGGLPFVGVLQQAGEPARVDARSMATALGPESLRAESMRAWVVDGGVAVEAGDGYVGLATRDARQFLAASASLGIEMGAWDYATLRDEG
jgi:hypothetical protein